MEGNPPSDGDVVAPSVADARRRRRRHGRSRRPRGRGRAWLFGGVLVAPMLVAATVDMLRVVQLGPITGLGFVTMLEIALVALTLPMVRAYPRVLVRRLAPWGALLGWALISTAWHVPAIDGAQNGLVYLLFGLLLLTAGIWATRRRETAERVIDGAVVAMTVIGLGLALVNVGPKGWPQAAPRGAGWWYVNPRPYALMGLVPLAWHLARWYHGRRWDVLPVALWVAAIFVSLSRTATATAMLLVALVVGLHLRRGRIEGRRTTAVERLLLTAVPIAAIVAAVHFQPFNERLVERSTRIGGGVVTSETRVRDSGRLNIWSAVLASTMKSPVFGQGLGTADVAINEVYEEVAHPHDDYLRIWHDLGLVGLACLLLSLGGWFRALYRDWQWSMHGASDDGRLELAALLALAGLALGMITDNSLVYACVMAPVGVIVGAALGGRAPLPASTGPTKRRRRRRVHPRPSDPGSDESGRDSSVAPTRKRRVRRRRQA